ARRQDGDSQGTGRDTHSVNDDTFSVIPCCMNFSRYAVGRPPKSLCNLITPPYARCKRKPSAIGVHCPGKVAKAQTAIRFILSVLIYSVPPALVLSQSRVIHLADRRSVPQHLCPLTHNALTDAVTIGVHCAS